MVARKSRKFILPFLLLLMVGLISLAPPKSSGFQDTCCQKCVNRFFQCDANNIVCCQIYTACIASCPNRCQGCPDE